MLGLFVLIRTTNIEMQSRWTAVSAVILLEEADLHGLIGRLEQMSREVGATEFPLVIHRVRVVNM